jgi:hypothetical protein
LSLDTCLAERDGGKWQRKHQTRRLVFRLRFEPVTSQIQSTTHSNTTSIYVDLNNITVNTVVVEQN